MIIVINKKVVRNITISIIFLILVISFAAILKGRSSAEKVSNLYTPIEKPIDRGNEKSKYIAFTCNVDWGNEVLPDMLKTLEEKDVKITFFVTGRWAKEFPDLFKQIIDAGHEIGSHGFQHLNYSTLSLEQNKQQLEKADEIIKSHTNKEISFFAPPSGAYNENTLIAAENLKYKTILWTIDTIDWRQGSTKDIIYDRVMNKENHNGAIVLMHPMAETAKVLPQLIDGLREKGLEVGRVSDVLRQ